MVVVIKYLVCFRYRIDNRKRSTCSNSPVLVHRLTYNVGTEGSSVVAIINVRRVRDALVRAEVTDEARGLELATSLDEVLNETVVAKERLGTLEERLDTRFERIDAMFERIEARFDRMAASVDARFSRAEADAERRANRHTAIFLAALAVAVGVIGILIAVL